MHLLVIQPLAGHGAVRRPYRAEVARLGARLRQRGHTVALLLVSGDSNHAALSETLRAAATDQPPALAVLYVDSLATDLAFRVADALRRIHPVPLVLLGPFARLCPNEALSMIGVEAVATGAADLAIPDYLDARSQGPELERAPGLAVNCKTGVMRNPPVKPPPSLDAEPMPARDLYPYEYVLDPAGLAEVEASRGGEPTDAGPDDAGPFAAPDWPVLHRPLEAVLDEMVHVATEYMACGGFRVGSTRWASSVEWVRAFSRRHAEEIALPFRTTLHAPDVTQEVADLLWKAGCEEVRLVVGSGSSMIRTDVLGIDTRNDAFKAAFTAVHRAGIAAAAVVDVGAPYETSVTLDETIGLLRRLRPDRVEAHLHYPAPGSRSHAVARENGLLVADPAGAYLAGRPALALPRLPEQAVLAAAESLPYEVVRPRIAALIRLARRVRLGRFGTLHERVVRPFLGPPVRPGAYRRAEEGKARHA